MALNISSKETERITLIPALLEELQCFQNMLCLSYLGAIFVCCHRNWGYGRTIFNICFTQQDPLYSFG